MVVFQIDLFNAAGPLPKTIQEADERERDIHFSSRTRMNTNTSLRIHKARMALRDLLGLGLPAGSRQGRGHRPAPGHIARENAVKIVQLIYRKRPYEGRTKDYEFSRPTMLEHWASGLAERTQCTVQRLPRADRHSRPKGP